VLACLAGADHDEKTTKHFHQLMQLYNKSAFYYGQAYDNIKAGKDKFHLPFKAAVKKHHSPAFLVTHFVEHYVATLFHDVSPKDTKIYVTQK
jgi:hypothetical protein